MPGSAASPPISVASSESGLSGSSGPASSNSIGQNANQRVFATLICEATGPFVEHSTSKTGVALDEDGDFRIDDTLDSVPSGCASPVLLIRNTVGVWFAAGIPKHGDD